MIKILSFFTRLGWITIKEIDEKLISVKFGKTMNTGRSVFLNKAKKQIIKYTNKRLNFFDLDILLNGSALQKKIWNEIKKIPYGKKISYGKIAKKLKTSPRYVGSVCGKNNHLLIIPCHRVVRSNGKLGGFSGLGGIKLKNKLLCLEKNV